MKYPHAPVLRPATVAALVAALFQPVLSHAQEQGRATLNLPAVDVVSTTPLPGTTQPKDQVPANVQSVSPQALSAKTDVSLPDLLNRNLGSVNINDIQGNPFQADLNYRGFTASPLLGTPQGLSVYMDGVRMNQPFGDVVSWDLIPRAAVASTTIMPGSNPLFGLNTLGGALVMQTKDGFSHPGTSLEMGFGQYGRQSMEIEHGGSNDKGLHWYLTGTAFKESGWRDDSPSRVGQFFGKLGWVDAKTDLAMSLALANSKMNGNGLQELRLLNQSYSSVYTKPDETKNRSMLLNLTGKHSVNDDLLLSGNAYYRKINTSTFNGDLNEDSLDQSVYQPNAAERAALTAAGYSGFPTSGANASNTPFPYWRCIANVLLSDEPAEKCNGLINRTESSQENYGWSGQFTQFGKLLDKQNQFTAGMGYDASRIEFKQTAQFGYLNPDRSITPVNFYADGTELDDQGKPIDSRVDITGRSRTWSLFATDTLSLNEFLHFTLSGRYNHSTVRTRDSITPGGGAGSLDGDHHFSRFNPAIGFSFLPSKDLNVYGGYNEGSRTPTVVELGCADPANPCKLPNAMAGDPPLKQVVTKTWELGVRGRMGHSTQWNAGVFRADNFDDILFVADNAAGYGYFKNFGQTRRQGLELGLSSQIEDFRFSANYTYLDATFQSAETVNGAANSSADANGNINIQAGNRLPLIPRHILKLQGTWQVTPAWAVGLGMQTISSTIARGNENGQHQSDGTYFLGSGHNPGYTVFDLNTQYRASPALSFFANIYNLFNRQYSSAAQLGANGFTANGSFIARPFSSSGDNTSLVHSTFYAPGAPRTLWAGLRYEFGK